MAISYCRSRSLPLYRNPFLVGRTAILAPRRRRHRTVSSLWCSRGHRPRRLQPAPASRPDCPAQAMLLEVHTELKAGPVSQRTRAGRCGSLMPATPHSLACRCRLAALSQRGLLSAELANPLEAMLPDVHSGRMAGPRPQQAAEDRIKRGIYPLTAALRTSLRQAPIRSFTIHVLIVCCF